MSKRGFFIALILGILFLSLISFVSGNNGFELGSTYPTQNKMESFGFQLSAEYYDAIWNGLTDGTYTIDNVWNNNIPSLRDKWFKDAGAYMQSTCYSQCAPGTEDPYSACGGKCSQTGDQLGGEWDNTARDDAAADWEKVHSGGAANSGPITTPASACQSTAQTISNNLAKEEQQIADNIQQVYGLDLGQIQKMCNEASSGTGSCKIVNLCGPAKKTCISFIKNRIDAFKLNEKTLAESANRILAKLSPDQQAKECLMVASSGGSIGSNENSNAHPALLSDLSSPSKFESVIGYTPPIISQSEVDSAQSAEAARLKEGDQAILDEKAKYAELFGRKAEANQSQNLDSPPFSIHGYLNARFLSGIPDDFSLQQSSDGQIYLISGGGDQAVFDGIGVTVGEYAIGPWIDTGTFVVKTTPNNGAAGITAQATGTEDWGQIDFNTTIDPKSGKEKLVPQIHPNPNAVPGEKKINVEVSKDGQKVADIPFAVDVQPEHPANTDLSNVNNNSSSSTGGALKWILLIVVLGAIAGGVYYFIKIRNKQQVA